MTALLWLALLILLSALLTAVSIYFIGTYTDIIIEMAEARVQDELFARLFVFWVIVLFYAAILGGKSIRSRFSAQRWFFILLVLFALGAAFALGDPNYLISDEYNLIRYWTAGVLGVAGVISVLCSLDSKYALPDRLFGFAFGLLLMLAGGDELLQYHEHMSGQIDTILSTGSQLSGQDLVTLGFAVLGAVAVLLAVLALRFLPQAKKIIQDGRYNKTFSFFALAVFVFLAAMLLDTFDWYLQLSANSLLRTVFGPSIENEALRWYGEDYVTYAANSVEELLEYLAALLFLMMIGTLFCVKALGCALPDKSKS